MKINDALQLIGSRLISSTETPALDSQLMLAHIMGRPRAWIIAHPEVMLSEKEVSELGSVMRHVGKIPLPYLLGKWEFFGLEFKVDPNVLIPRPETELLVERALSWKRSRGSKCMGIDIGTGSGCIAISLLLNTDDVYFIASDISRNSLKVAHQNARDHHVAHRISFIQADLFPSVCVRFDMICANLPYIPTKTLKSLPIYYREPIIAVDGGFDGLKDIRSMLQTAPQYLAEGGILLCEIEYSQGKAVQLLAKQYFPDHQIQIVPDLAGLDRLLVVENPPKRNPEIN